MSSSSQAKHGLASRRVRKKSKIVEVALLRSVSVDLVELRRVFKVKYFRFMDKIVTGGVGHLEG